MLDLSHTGCQRCSSFGVITKGGGDLSAFLFTLDFFDTRLHPELPRLLGFCSRGDGYGEQTPTSVCLPLWNAWNEMLVILHIIASQRSSWQITTSQKTFNEQLFLALQRADCFPRKTFWVNSVWPYPVLGILLHPQLVLQKWKTCTRPKILSQMSGFGGC